MENSLKNNLLSKITWMRALYMLLFFVLGTVARFIFVLAVIFQFAFMLFTGRVNANLLRFGNSLSTYIYQIMLFLTYNSEEKPYPFNSWPG